MHVAPVQGRRQTVVRRIPSPSVSGTSSTDSRSSRSRHVGPARVAEQHLRARGPSRGQEGQHPLGHLAVVADVAGQDDVRVGGGRPAGRRRRDRADAVELGVDDDGGAAVGVDLAGDDPGGPGQEGGDGDQPAAGAEVEHRPAGDQRRVVEHVPGQRLATGPGAGQARARPAGAGRRPDGARPGLRQRAGRRGRRARRGLRRRRQRVDPFGCTAIGLNASSTAFRRSRSWATSWRPSRPTRTSSWPVTSATTG